MEFLKIFFRFWKSLMNSRGDLPPPWPWQRGVRHLGFTHGYHSGRGCHGNGTCCHGYRLGCHGNWGILHHVTKECGHVTRDPRDRPWSLALVGARSPVFHTTCMCAHVKDILLL